MPGKDKNASSEAPDGAVLVGRFGTNHMLALDGQEAERTAKLAIEQRGFAVLDANVAFRANCPNFDLVVTNRDGPVYVQVRSSKKPSKAGRIILGAWNQKKLAGAPLYNKHRGFPAASVVLIVVVWRTGETEFYLAPPEVLDKMHRPSALAFAKKPKLDGTLRNPNFRAEVPKEALAHWRDRWELLGHPPIASSSTSRQITSL